MKNKEIKKLLIQILKNQKSLMESKSPVPIGYHLIHSFTPRIIETEKLIFENNKELKNEK